LHKKAIIIGCDGQDGRLLSDYLSLKGYSVTGISKNNFNILDSNSVIMLVKELLPNEIYFLAAYHNSSEGRPESDEDIFANSFEINTIALSTCLHAIQKYSKLTKLFYASSCLIYEGSSEEFINENSIICPQSPYAISKYSGMQVCNYYKNIKSLFVCSGILFNHESPLRKNKFVSKKIVECVARILKGSKESLEIGDLESKVDWGYASDYVEAMNLMLQLNEPHDFIIATGETHSVREFVEYAFFYAGLNYEDHVVVNSDLITKRKNIKSGDPSLIKSKTGWYPRVSFTKMIENMVDFEISALK